MGVEAAFFGVVFMFPSFHRQPERARPVENQTAPLPRPTVAQNRKTYLKKLNPFFFSGIGGPPQTDSVICRITRDIPAPSSLSGAAVFCIRRTAA